MPIVPILTGTASSMAWALVEGGAGAAKAYVLGGPEDEAAGYVEGF